MSPKRLKQEAICLEAINAGIQTQRVIKDWITFYNTKQPNSALDRLMSDGAYWAVLEKKKTA